MCAVCYRDLIRLRSDTLSRLKGIETFLLPYSSTLRVISRFRYAFPFEGNWNLYKQTIGISEIAFRYAFPFEGNWNSWLFFRKIPGGYVQIRFPVWRELKRSFSNHFFHRISVQIRFPVWRELKPFTPAIPSLTPSRCSDTLSRLKGIETLPFVPPLVEIESLL